MMTAYFKAVAAVEAFNKHMRALRKDESGASMIEYALLAGLISIAAIVAITAVGGKVNDVFGSVKNSMPAAPAA
jgi:pilus assembly protein Flp/PilA